jgi:hypothetical protein
LLSPLFCCWNEPTGLDERDDRLRHAGDGFERLLADFAAGSFELEACDGAHGKTPS